MSIQAVGAVLDIDDIEETAPKMLLVCIANAHNTSTGMCCPSIKRLGKEAAMSRASVKRWLAWLADEKLNGKRPYIQRQVRHDQHGRQLSYDFRLTFMEGGHAGQGRGSPVDPRGFTVNPYVGVQSGPGSSWTPPPNEPGEGFTGEPGEGFNCEPPLKEPEEKPEEKPERGTSGDFRQRRISPVDGQHAHQSTSDRADGQRGLWNGTKASAASGETKKIAEGDQIEVRDGGTGSLFAECERLMGRHMPRNKHGAWFFPADIVDQARAELAARSRRGVG